MNEVVLSTDGYRAPKAWELSNRLCEDGRAIITDADLHPSSSIDNRDAVRMLMMLLGVPYSGATWNRVAWCYDTGLYKRFDGKSHPVPRYRTPAYMKRMGITKDPFSMPHDNGYYSGLTWDGVAVGRPVLDREYLEDHEISGDTRLGALIEYWALRYSPWSRTAWKMHRARREFSEAAGDRPRYGTVAWARQFADGAAFLAGTHELDLRMAA